MKATVYNQQGEAVGEVELSERVFGAPVNQGLIHQAVVATLANKRQGTSETKTRAVVAGGGRKPWRQKGTGRARQGSIRSPLWRKGGIVFGPHPRSYRQELPRKMRRAALRAALSARALSGDIVVLDRLELEAPKTKVFASVLKALGAPQALFVSEAHRPELALSARNVAKAEAVVAQNLSAYQVLRYPKLICTRDALARLEEVLG